MRKIISVIITVALCLTLSAPAFASENSDGNISSIPLGYERIVAAITNAGLDYTIRNNQVQLVNPTPENIELANNALVESFNRTYGVNASPETRSGDYPTEWVDNPIPNYRTNTVVRKALKDALVRTVVTEVSSKAILTGAVSIKAVAVVFVANFLLAVYANQDTAGVFYEYTYYYREYGPGWTDMNGNFYGEFENREDIRITLNNDYTGGEVTSTIVQDTQVLPM